MTEQEFSKLTIQIESYCNTDMFDDTANAYRRMFINRNYDQVREAVDLAYMGGYLNENAQKRTIPAPHIFDQFFRNIESRENKVPQMPEMPIEQIKYNLGLLAIVVGLMRICFKPDYSGDMRWGNVRVSGETWAQKCVNFWNEFGRGDWEIFLETIASVAPGLEKEIEITINKPELQSDVPF